MQTRKRTLKTPPETGSLSRRDIRAAVRAVHVLQQPGAGWEVRRSGQGRLRPPFASKQAAVEFARTVGRRYHADLIIHERDGRIERVASAVGAPPAWKATSRARS
jgi:hypothetical protein